MSRKGNLILIMRRLDKPKSDPKCLAFLQTKHSEPWHTACFQTEIFLFGFASSQHLIWVKQLQRLHEIPLRLIFPSVIHTIFYSFDYCLGVKLSTYFIVLPVVLRVSNVMFWQRRQFYFMIVVVLFVWRYHVFHINKHRPLD